MLSARITRHSQKAYVRAFASGTVFEKFNFEDAFDLNGQLTDDERMISEVAR